jgi:hypothetical protein
MATDKQIRSARYNGRKSNGPTSPEGKARSARNATKHGLTSTTGAAMRTENDGIYERLEAAYIEHFQPVGGLEEDLVGQLVNASLRMRRLTRFEVGMYHEQMDKHEKVRKEYRDPVPEPEVQEAAAFRAICGTSNAVDVTLRYEYRMRRSYDMALKTLRDLQRERQNSIWSNEPDFAKPAIESSDCSVIPTNPINEPIQ